MLKQAPQKRFSSDYFAPIFGVTVQIEKGDETILTSNIIILLKDASIQK